MKYTEEILNIIKKAINLALYNNKKKITIIKPIHLFISIFLTNNFTSNLYLLPNIKILKLIEKKYNINYNNKIIFSEKSINLFKSNNNILTSLDLFINILNSVDKDINNLLKSLNTSINYIKYNFINLFIKNNLNLNKNLLKYLFNLNYILNKNNKKYIKVINTELIKNILKNNNLFLIGENGVGKKSIIYYYIIENIYNIIKYNQYYLELNIEKLIIDKKSLDNIENYLYELFNTITKFNGIYFIIIPNINLIFFENENFNNSINNLFNYFIKFKNLKFIFTSNKDNYYLISKKKESIINNFNYLNIEEPNKKYIKNIINLYLNYYYKKYNLYIDNKLLNKIINLFYEYNLEKKNPLKILNFINFIINNKIYNYNNYFNKFYNLNNNFKNKYYYNIYNYLIIYWKKYIKIYKNLIPLNKINNKIYINNYNFNFLNNIYKNKINNNIFKNNIINEYLILKYLPFFIKLPKEFLKSKLINKVNIKEKLKDYIKLEKTLKKRIFGQNSAIEQILNSIKKNKLGLKSNNKPIGSYIFAGLSGTGKTELVKSLAEGLFGNENSMIRFDMSEFMEKHSISRLIGSPPGYIGHEDGGQLTNAVIKNPYSIILLDEIEKAHPDITNILLQLLDDGRLTDSKGNLIDFTNTIIVLTTNLGSPKNLIKYPFLKNKGRLSKNEFNKFILNTNNAIEKFFRPEFLNRLDSIIVFKPLGLDELKNIAYKFINNFNLKIKNNKFYLSFYIDKSFINLILKISYKPLYGARPLKRIIEKLIEKPINELLLYFNINCNTLVYFYIDLITNKPSLSLLKII